jgi:hypothetical protein
MSHAANTSTVRNRQCVRLFSRWNADLENGCYDAMTLPHEQHDPQSHTYEGTSQSV